MKERACSIAPSSCSLIRVSSDTSTGRLDWRCRREAFVKKGKTHQRLTQCIVEFLRQHSRCSRSEISPQFLVEVSLVVHALTVPWRRLLPIFCRVPRF